jgi:hypothetical protein
MLEGLMWASAEGCKKSQSSDNSVVRAGKPGPDP